MRISILFVFALTIMTAGCAEGIISGEDGDNQNGTSVDVNNGNHSDVGGNADEADAGYDADASNDGDVGYDDDSSNDADVGESSDISEDDDVGDDVGEPDPCEIVTCGDGVCDPDSGECVECLGDGDCPDELICSDDGPTCLPCEEHDDCAGDAKCHDEYPSCVAECCDFIDDEVFENFNTHNAIDIAVTSAGEPIILFANGNTDTVHIAEHTSSGWFTQTVTTYSSFSINVSLDLDGDDNPHVLVRGYNDWRYFSRFGGTWSEAEVWDDDVSTGTVDIVMDDDENAHIFGLNSGQIYYAMYENGSWTRDIFELDDNLNPVWLVGAVKSDGTPVASVSGFMVGDGNSVWEIHVAEKIGVGWEMEAVVDYSTQVHHMGVGPTDEIFLAHHSPAMPHDGVNVSRDGGDGNWQTETVNPAENGTGLYMDIDHRNDPHIINQDSSATSSVLSYTRWDGDSWEVSGVPPSVVEESSAQRMAVDDDSVAHIVVYSSASNILSYVTMQ